MVKKYDPHAGDNKIIWPAALPFDANDRATSGTNAAAVVTIGADAARPINLVQIHCSYSAAPTGGQIKVEDGSGTVVFRQYISGAGPYEFNFTPPRCGSQNTNLIVTLAAGGTGIIGELDVNAHLLV